MKFISFPWVKQHLEELKLFFLWYLAPLFKYSNEISEKVIEEVMVTGQSSILSEEHLKTAINELRKYYTDVMLDLKVRE